jgi:hypothetical protein
MVKGTRKFSVLALVAAAMALTASLADAELVERGDLFVHFSGGIAPDSLPRDAHAPIAVRVAGTVKTLSGQRPPALRKISIAINNGGRLDTDGLPRCRQGQIASASDRTALQVCGPALVGRGSYAASIAFPEQFAFPTRGRILAFNAVVGGHRAILAHIYGTDPAPITRIIVFHIRENPGTYGTVLVGSLPPSLNRYGYVTRIGLNLHRNYTFRGERHSYLSAACAAPAGFPGAVFPFARASMSFADGRILASTLTRSCKVR